MGFLGRINIAKSPLAKLINALNINNKKVALISLHINKLATNHSNIDAPAEQSKARIFRVLLCIDENA